MLAVKQGFAVPVPTGVNLSKEIAPFVQQAEQEVQKAGASTVNYVRPTMHDLYHDDSSFKHAASVAGQGRT